MAEQLPFSLEKQFTGPEAPRESLAGLADDIISQIGEDHSNEHTIRLSASWNTPAGQTVHLHKFVKDNATIYRMRVMALGESEPVAGYRYPVGGKGVTQVDSQGKQLAGPHRDHERAMYKYLQSADVIWRNGTSNGLINDVFWRIAAQTVLSEQGVMAITESVTTRAPAVVRYAKLEEAATLVRRQELRLPEEVLYQALEEAFFPAEIDTA